MVISTWPPISRWPPYANLKCKINTLRPIRDRRDFADDIFKCVFLNENERISPRISLKFVPKGPINNNPALVQIMAWRRPGDKPLSESMLVRLKTHICVTRPQWVKQIKISHYLKQYWHIIDWTLRNKIQWNLNQNTVIFFQENRSEKIVCKLATILTRPQCAELQKYFRLGESMVCILENGGHL